MVGAPNTHVKGYLIRRLLAFPNHRKGSKGMPSLLKDRVKLALDAIPEAIPADLARFVGIRPASVSDWLSGKSGSLKGENLMKAAKFLRVNPDWLATGKGQMERGAEPAFLRPITVWENPGELPPDQTLSLRQLEFRLSCGKGGPDPNYIEETDKSLHFSAQWAQKMGWSSETHFSMRADGPSMEPTIQDNAPVVIAIHDRAIRSGKIYAFKIDGEPLLKFLDKLPGGRIRIRSDNQSPEFAAYDVHESEIEMVGRAVWTPKNL